MSKHEETILSLLTDPEFVRWVRSPDPALDIYWENWILAHPDKIKCLREAREMIEGLKAGQGDFSAARKYRVLQQILAKETSHTMSLKGKSASVPMTPFLWLIMGQWTKVAAILLLTLMSTFLWSKMVFNPPPLVPIEDARASVITKKTQFGEKLNFKLPDGSSVWLNSGSSLVFPEKFDSLERRVKLLGEGFFEIQKDSSRTFIVESGNLLTEALGTSFNVRYLDPEPPTVSLVSGKVRINHNNLENRFFLEPGQQLHFRKSNQSFEVIPFSLSDILGWKDGLLQFKDASFDEVVDQLERWYGVEINVAGRPSGKWKLSGKYQDQHLDLVLDRMAFIENFEYYIKGKNVNLKF
ncbi:FecR family protein [Cyclobacterium lianum]|uniref:FecR family protein n=1 Tax=Cyclobacterium lianum TaxID=388280 RepID=A0A1M7PEE4_9BACT|nr:FecR domain-containing protein [Cyclobacterium lianum]SHN15398.1 FecR family protein [Cyclobacterium lianum]